MCVAVHSANLHASGISDPDAVVRLAEKACVNQPVDGFWQAPLGMTYYRVGRFAEQVAWLKPHGDLWTVEPWSALGYQQLGQPDEAGRRLQVGDEPFLNEVRQAKAGPSYRYACSGVCCYDLDEYIIYRREAAQLIEGGTEAFDKIVADYVEEGRRELRATYSGTGGV